MAHPAQRRWYPIAFAVALLVLLPLSVLMFSWHEVDQQIWAHLWQTQLPRLIGNTLVLVLGVGVGVTLLGVSLAWLTSLCEFPGRRWLDWAAQANAMGARLAEGLVKAGERAAVLTLPDSLCWLLNIRGADVPRNPILHGHAILHDDGRVTLFAAAEKFDEATRAHLGPEVTLRPVAAFVPALRTLQGPVRVDKGTAPLAVSMELEEAGIAVAWGDDPCRLPKACKNAGEVAGMRAAHLRDGAAVVEFLCWLDDRLPQGGMTEIDVVTALEGYRRATNALHEISFDTICGAGPNGAIMHYRVTDESNRAVEANSLLLVDSGGQYLDGTTDITRTVAVGDPGGYARACYTRVLQGTIAISRVRWPKGLTGRDLDPLARAALWMAGQDFNHGTGHGVGAFLSVHEGPQRISRVSEVPLEVGMILSNEPGYYREGEFGIRLENLIVVEPAPHLQGGDSEREQLRFETLTFVPFDRRLIVTEMLAPGERDWLNAYHAEVRATLAPRLSPAAAAWLEAACARALYHATLQYRSASNGIFAPVTAQTTWLPAAMTRKPLGW